MSEIDPFWTKPASMPKTLDPLGLDRVSDRLIDDLLTGITALTNRARYYSFYLWAIKSTNQKQFEQFDDFCEHFYDKEKIYTLACISHGSFSPEEDHFNIEGSLVGRRKWLEAGKKIDLKRFRHLQHPLGGYGYYYQASLRKMGLVEQEPTCDKLTPLGESIARAFEKTYLKTEYSKKSSPGDSLAKSLIVDYGSKCCLCMLKNSDSPDREVLTKLMFAMNKEAIGDQRHLRRKNSLTLILYALNKVGSKVEKFDGQLFLDMTYFGQVASKEGPLNIKIPSQLSDTAELWKIFRSHDYFSFACESLFSSFLRILDINRTSGLSFSDFVFLLNEEKLNENLKEILPKESNGIKKIVTVKEVIALLLATVTKGSTDLDANSSRQFDLQSDLNSPINENFLTKSLIEINEAETFDLQQSVISALIILLLIYLRFYWRLRIRNKAFAWLISNSGSSDLSPSNFVQEMEIKLAGNVKLTEFLEWIFKRYILKQSTDVYNNKIASTDNEMPIAWFHADGSVYRIDRTYEPRFRNSRFNSCFTILNDLGLAQKSKINFEVSKTGEKLLQQLDIW